MMTVHAGDLHRYEVRVAGPKNIEHNVTVFATTWNQAAFAAVEKLQDKIIRHEYKDWGPVEGPWTVLAITVEC
jgi:hypothetical protein